MIARRRCLAGIAASPLALALSASSAKSSTGKSDRALSKNTTVPTPADIGFCQDMCVHHLQAIDMCLRVLGRQTGGSVQAAAAEVLQFQAMEVGQMRAWLTDWGESTVPPEYVMSWMLCTTDQRGMPLSSMPGYASAEAMAELSRLEGLRAGKRWLELMRAHHEGGVTMASEAITLASSEKVIRLAKSQVTAQSYEIQQYDILLSGKYG